jgi:AmmeMemoRadiSam system protein B
MTFIRHPAVAGSFYPANPPQLQDLLQHFLAEPAQDFPLPKAIIVPHAGYLYSGAIAASAYKRLKVGRDTIKRVVLLGPSHRVGFKGIAVSHAEFFQTPLGNVPLDLAAIENLLPFPFVEYIDEAHYLEHSLEVQLPFLQTVLQAFHLIPLVVGDASAEQVAQVLDLFYGAADTLIVISSDLSHYHDYATAQHIDRKTSAKIENLHYEHLEPESACGRIPISGLLALAREKSLTIKNIDLRNSGDTAGDKERVVGYGAYIIN